MRANHSMHIHVYNFVYTVYKATHHQSQHASITQGDKEVIKPQSHMATAI